MAHAGGAVKVVVKGPAFDMVGVLQPVRLAEFSIRHCVSWASRHYHGPQW